MPPFRIIAALMLLMAAPRLALAHAILIESQPALSATMAPGKTDIRLRFNSRIDQARSKIELRHPGGTPATLPLNPSPAPDILAATTDLAPGDWVLRWQVLAVDGHITRGDVPFTVKAP